jgi:hypothetical protein
MDVHAPHAPLHTWKDFWIHLGTITIGLLIAIGLEQSVEALHHVHQRHALEADLREEALKNETLFQWDYAYIRDLQLWLAQMQQQVAAARADAGKTKVKFSPAPQAQGVWWPDSPVWNTAKEGAEVGLLPNDTARMFNLMYVQQEELTLDVHKFFDAYGKELSFEMRFGDPFSKSGPDLTKMDAQDLREYQAALSETKMRLMAMQGSLVPADKATKTVLDGAKSDDDLFRALQEPVAAAKK